MHHVIFVPGLGDNNKNIGFMVRLWKKDGITVHIHFAPWQEKKEHLEPKLERLVTKIDYMTKHYAKVSLVGSSAGGSFILNAYAQRKDKIHRLITVSSRLLKGNRIFPSLAVASLAYPAFKESVIQCEALLPTLTASDKEKMLTTESKFFDGVVPLSTMRIPGVKFIQIPVPLHTISIGATMTLFRKPLIDFLRS